MAEAVAAAAAETAATAAMAMAIAGRGQDKREVKMWFQVFKIYTRCAWAGGTFFRCLKKVPLANLHSMCVVQEFGW